MALYVYKKKEIKTETLEKIRRLAEEEQMAAMQIESSEPEEEHERIIYKDEFKKYKKHLYNLIIPGILIITGASLLLSQISPYIKHFVLSNFTNSFDQEIISAVPSTYQDTRLKYITDPGASYFKDYMEKLNQNNSIDDNSKDYKGLLHISIEKIGLSNAPVTTNVDSADEAGYKKALESGLAHFKGSKIPGNRGNVFIYGHSAAGDFAKRNPNDYVIAFTNLFKLSIGDEIIVTKDSVEYRYTVYKIKEVSPDDTSVLEDQNGNTLTLMTCSPPGLDLKRLIVVARQVS